LRYLAKQGLVLRGHEPHTGNFAELLNLRSDDSKELQAFMHSVSNFTAPESQNEMLSLLRHSVLRHLVKIIKTESKQYSVVVDGTQDCAGLEQKSACVRYVNSQLEPVDAFLGLYQPPDTKRSTIATVIEDVLLHFDLPIDDLSGQIYDSAANMAGEYNGCQAIIARKQPLALHFHCGGHCSNLVVQAASMSCLLVTEALERTHELW